MRRRRRKTATITRDLLKEGGLKLHRLLREFFRTPNNLLRGRWIESESRNRRQERETIRLRLENALSCRDPLCAQRDDGKT